jgi:tripartite-type tricarboxylate transporter receptor subunit TctC
LAITALRKRIGTALSALTSSVLAAMPVHAQAPDQFYAGRTINLIVPSNPGGAYDISARLVGRHLGRHIPGQPSVVVQNQSGGAAGIVLANRLGNTPETNGTLIAGMLRSVPQFAIMGDPNARFDPVKLEWLGSISSFATDSYVLVANANGKLGSVDDLKKPGTKIHLGANRSGSTNLTFALMLKEVYKYNVEIVRGFPGAADIMLALQRGEVDGTLIDMSAILAGQKDLWNTGKLKVVIQFARTKPLLPHLPDAAIGRDLLTDARDRALVEFAELPFFMGFPFVAPAGTEPARLVALRKGFDAMVADAAFKEDAAKIGFPLSPIDAAAVKKLVEQTAATPKDVVERFKKLLE